MRFVPALVVFFNTTDNDLIFWYSLENLVSLVRKLTQAVRWANGALQEYERELGRGPRADQPDIFHDFKNL